MSVCSTGSVTILETSDGWRNSNGLARRATTMLNGKIGRSRGNQLDTLKRLETSL